MLEKEHFRNGQLAANHDGRTRVVSASMYNHVVQKQHEAVEFANALEAALRHLHAIAHKEVSPRHSPELDEAFTRAEILLDGEFDDETV